MLEKMEYSKQFPPQALLKELHRNFVLSNIFMRIYKEDMERDTGISLTEWKVLEAVYHCEGIFARDIIDFWELEKSISSRSIKRLERRGLIVRKTPAKDKRYYKLFITPKGEKMYYALRDSKNRLFDYIEMNLPERDLAKFGEVTEKMIHLLRDYLSNKD